MEATTMNQKACNPMADLFAATEACVTRIYANGYKLLVKWEWQWLEENNQDQAIWQLV